MGGYNSGRHGGRPTVEDGLTLTLSKLILEGLFHPGQSRSSSIVCDPAQRNITRRYASR